MVKRYKEQEKTMAREEYARTLARDAAESKKLTDLLDESQNFNEGRTRRSIPLKKIAEIRKAQRKFKQAAIDMAGEARLEDDVEYFRVTRNNDKYASTIFLKDFMPRRGTDKVEKFRKWTDRMNFEEGRRDRVD